MTQRNIMRQTENGRDLPQSRSFYERRVVPSADIIEGKNEFTVRLDMPGVEKDSIDLKVDGDSLRVRGSAGDYHKDNPNMITREILPTVYEREFHVGKDIDRNDIIGEYNEGVLIITLRKSEAAKPREIKIK